MASRDGTVTLTFRREVPDLESAVSLAIKQLRIANCEVAKIKMLDVPVAA